MAVAAREEEDRLVFFLFAALIAECGTDRTFFKASSKIAYSLAAFLAEGFE